MGDNLSRASTHGMCDLIEFLVDASKPQRITTDRDLQYITVHTDGALSARGGSCRALVMNPATSSEEVYSGWAPKLLLEFWWDTGGERIICEVGGYAHLCVKLAGGQGWITRFASSNTKSADLASSNAAALRQPCFAFVFNIHNRY